MAFVLVMAMMLTACNPDGMDQVAEEALELAELDAMVEATFEDIDDVSYEGMDEAFGRNYQSRSGHPKPMCDSNLRHLNKVLTLTSEQDV